MPMLIKCPTCSHGGAAIIRVPTKKSTRYQELEAQKNMCDGCPKKNGREKFEYAIKKGLWLRKYDKATENFENARKQWQGIEGTDVDDASAYVLARVCDIKTLATNEELTELTSLNPNLLQLLQVLTEGGLIERLKSAELFEYGDFEPIAIEAKGWLALHQGLSYFRSRDITNGSAFIKRGISEMLKLDRRLLLFSKDITGIRERASDIALKYDAIRHQRIGATVSYTDPSMAAKHFSTAALAYEELGLRKTTKSLKHISRLLRKTRACWICGARFQGDGYHFDYIRNDALKNPGAREYYLDILNQRKEVLGYLRPETIGGKALAVCKICSGLPTTIAFQIASKLMNELRVEFNQRIQALQSEIASLRSALKLRRLR